MAVYNPKIISFVKGENTYSLRCLTSDEETAVASISNKKNIQTAVTDPTASGTGVTFIDTISQDAQGVIAPTKKTVRTFTKATSSAAGTTGLVPAPAKGKQTTFLRGDATWVEISSATVGLDAVNNTSDADKPISTATQSALDGKLDTSLKGANSGLAELDANGKVPTSQLPSYVDDVLEYADLASFPAEGESGKIYVALDTNKTYRWSGTAYVEISPSLALGTTSTTAYRGDRGASAYKHAVTNKGSAFESGLYKITTNSEGHVTAATAVAKSDITALGIPGDDTNTTYSLTQDSSDGHKITLTPSSGTAQTITIPDNDTKVTSAANHYSPSRDSTADKSASASGATAAWSIDVVKGVTLQTDGKGHVTGVAVTSGKIPANPNTDENVTNTLNATAKYYVTGTTSSSTNTGTQVFDDGIYATTTAGQLNAVSYKVNEHCTLQWNSTDECLDFVFA